MENTSEFVKKLAEDKKKQDYNKTHQGKGHPDKKLPNNQHN
ncbi:MULTISPECIES: DUF4023 family protein [Bacillaceae]|uniref:DUF4023 domain-containing protein n=1 Tax=Bacillus salipaludis TaxID=2547811 RepID=A0A4R5VZC3_9BACI|nr:MULTISPECIES: DUF4023 family protein [Bacillaceae]MBI0578155.1 DUF4023 family protein [Neobacillus cucumis]MDQ6595211.1 DUF4023 family protein [Bacillus salipaludis]MED1469103.1 DUF4023 family protein [Bacillus salipaludis]TDK63938.1 DUF4023 domain-containing protein [Bacillus salipaludis]WHY91867.1 DUF4023 family protein [Neobacillus cucumis]